MHRYVFFVVAFAATIGPVRVLRAQDNSQPSAPVLAPAPSPASPVPAPALGAPPSSAGKGSSDGSSDASLKSGKLSRYGITAGLALVGHVPVNKNQTQVGVGGMPYVEVLPLIWLIRGSISRAYCVAQLTEPNAQQVADLIALSRTKGKLLDIPESSLRTMVAVPTDATSGAGFQAILQGVTNLGSLSDDQLLYVVKHVPSLAKLVYDETGWLVDVPASGCAWSWFGIYGGLPSNFTVNSSVAGGAETARQFQPIGSAGITFSPTSLVRLMAGFTWSNVADDAKQNAVVPSFTFGLGGNLDIAGALLGK